MKKSNLPALLLLAVYLTIPASAALLYIARQPLPQLPIQFPKPEFNSTEAYNLLVNLTRDYQGRVIGSTNDTQVAYWIANWFQKQGLNTTLQTFPTINFQGQRVNGTNVIAVSPGTTNRTLILMAHHDVVPAAPQGANDNGSGTVTLMELARSLTRTTHNLTYYFLSTDSEEINLGGSQYFAQHTAKQLNISLALSIDEVGHKDAQGLLIYAYNHENNYTDLGTMLTASIIGQRVDLPTAPQLSDQLFRRAGIRLFSSDSESFLAQGIQAYALADDPLYPYTHTPRDTIDKVSATRLDSVGRWIETLTLNLNQNHTNPTMGSSYLIYSDGYITGTELNLHFTTYVLVAAATPAFLLLRGRPGRSEFLATTKPTLATFLILLTAAIMPLGYRLLGLWPPWSTTLQNILAIFYLGETLTIIALLSLYSARIFRKLGIQQSEHHESRPFWIAILLSTTFLLNLLANPYATILFLSLPTLLLTLTQARRRQGSNLNLLTALLTPFPLYAVAIGALLIYGYLGAISLLIGEITSIGIIRLQLASAAAIVTSVGYSIRDSLEKT